MHNYCTYASLHAVVVSPYCKKQYMTLTNGINHIESSEILLKCKFTH